LELRKKKGLVFHRQVRAMKHDDLTGSAAVHGAALPPRLLLLRKRWGVR
jgi:hypothetical protein